MLFIEAKTQDVFDYDVECAYVYTADINRYFNAEEYVENDVMNYITLSQDIVFLKKATEIDLKKSVAKNEIQFFNFSFLDTSDISIINLGTDFTNYVVERTY